jgi:hypothetical protein
LGRLLSLIGAALVAAEDIVRYGGHDPHLFDIMNAHDMRAGHDGCSDGRGGRELRLVLGGLGEERLARGADQHRQLEFRHLTKAGDDLGILLAALSKTDAGIDHDAISIDTGPAGAAYRSFEVLQDGAHDVSQRTERRPGFRTAAHVIENNAGVELDDGFNELRIEGETAGIVDDFGAEFEGAFGGLGLVGIDGNRDAELLAQPLENGNNAAEFFFRGDGLSAGFGGLAADVDDIGALLFHLHGAGESEIGVKVFAAVRERIGRDVEDAHDESAIAEGEFAVA